MNILEILDKHSSWDHTKGCKVLSARRFSKVVKDIQKNYDLKKPTCPVCGSKKISTSICKDYYCEARNCGEHFNL